MTIRPSLLLLAALVCCCHAALAQRNTPAPQPPAAAAAQDSEEVLRVSTNVVFIDTLVRDKKTGAPVRDLAADSFRVLADGRPRELSYFSREGVKRRPLALVLVLDLYTAGILYLEKPEVMEQIVAALSKLPPEDEIAVVQAWYEPQAERLSFQLRSRTVEGLTRDRARTFAALRGAQQFARANLPSVKLFFSLKETYRATWKDSILAGMKTAAGVAPIDPPFKITVAPDFENQLDKSPLLATRERPDSSVVVLDITDDLGAERFGESDARARRLIASGVTVGGLVVKKDLLGKAVDLTGRVVSPLVGARFHTVSYYGRETGGEVATVGRAEEFSAAVERIVAGLAGRYSLGFTLGD
ncbi:MAG: hypothetical protein M3268_08190, partial [Acidobacteriota bacterium]|nr:hypothetical protein [Acidobacteriota bacterium]